MVKKLIKHEMTAVARTMLPMEIILVGIALLARFVQVFESDTISYRILFVSSIIALIIGIAVCLVMTVAVGISRFYKNLFTAEGYLSFTLPVTPAQHIFAKLLVSVIFFFITLGTIVVSCCVVTFGEVLVEIIRAVVYLAKMYFQYIGAHGAAYIVEAFLLVVVVITSTFLQYYACIALGQMARKNRVLAAFGVYFGYYFACQILGTILIIIFTFLSDFIDFTIISQFINKHPYAFVHLLLWFGIVFYAALSALYFFVAHRVIKKRLNLE